MPGNQWQITNKSLLIVGCCLLVILVVDALAIWQPWQGWQSQSVEGTPGSLYWYCPHCGLELPCPAGYEKKTSPCPRCARKDRFLQVSTSPHKGGTFAFAASRWFLFTVLGGPVALSLLWLGITWYRQARDDPRNNPNYLCACPGCTRKLAYRLYDVGKHMVCPYCGTRILCPPPAEVVTVGTWQKYIKLWRAQARHQPGPRPRRER
jgi:hypothetical protein